MYCLNKKGAVTVFMGIIIPVIIAVCALLTDLYLYETAKKIVSNSVDASAYMVLGKYSAYLKDNYDLYAYCMGAYTAEELVYSGIRGNLPEGGLYDFRIEEVKVNMADSLIDESVFFQSVMVPAGDDGCRALVEVFVEKFDVLSGLGKAAKLISLKMKIDEAYRSIKDAMAALNVLINGDGSDGPRINIDGVDSSFLDAVNEFRGYMNELKEVEEKINELTAGVKVPDERITAKELLEEQAGRLRELAAELYNSFIEGVVHGLLEANRNAVGKIKDIVAGNEKIHILSESIHEAAEGFSDCPVYIKEILAVCADITEDVEEAFVEQVFEEIRIALEGNIRSLLNLRDVFETAVEDYGCETVVSTLAEYNSDIRYVYDDDLTKGSGGEDRRNFFEELGKRVLEKQMGRDVKVGEFIVLPSDGKVADTFQFNVTSLGKDTMTCEHAMDSFSSDVGQKYGLLETAALNEYIIRRFSNEISEKSASSYTFFDNEAEYILWGHDSQNANSFMTKAAVMTARFVMDALHVYSDSEKSAFADGLAAAAAGWWTAGAGIPVMSNLIKISWSVAEAGADLKRLLSGSDIPMLKTKADWITDIGVPDEGAGSVNPLKMSYEDYLRLFLLMEPLDKKLTRMLDVIVLNSPGNFSVFNAYTAVEVTAVISFRSLTGGRNEIEISGKKSYIWDDKH